MSNMINSMNCMRCGAEIDTYINGEQYCKDCQMQPLDNGTFRNNDGNINPQVTWQLTSDFKYKVYIWATGD